MRVRRYDAWKRAIDLVASVALLVITLPLQTVIALLVALWLGRPVLFRQLRPGQGGELFTIVKFRSMRDADEDQGLVLDADRLSPFGRALRSTSLDELPELWNVMRGEMSFIGPRPLLVEYLERYTPEQARRHEVRPGITGLAQVSGRNALTWEEKFRLDVEYVERRSLVMDARILVRTVRSVFARDGISHAGAATMHKFGEVPDAN